MENRRGRKALVIDIERIKELIALGVPKTVISKSLGISRASLYRALERCSNES